MNFHTKYFPIITKFILFFCVGFFLLGAISSCKKNNDVGDDLVEVVENVTLSFETNGGTTINPLEVKKGEKATSPTTPTKDGFVFQGWFADKEFTTPFNFDEAITMDRTIYAQWLARNPDAYMLTFNTNEGTTINPLEVKKGEKATKPADPTKNEFVFNGWFADKEFTTPFDFDVAITMDMTVYAQWTTFTKDFAGAVLAKKIPNDIATYTDELSKEVLSHYTAGAELVVRHLSPTGTDDGSSWGKAQGDLKKVLEDITDASSNKIYLILLATGEYKAGAEISMKNNVAIVGGFTAPKDEDYTQSTTETALSGNGQYRVFYNKGGIDNSALLYGVKITAGQTNGSGGGMYNETSSSPILSYVTFAGNTASTGGGMSNYSSSPTLNYVTFAGNTANNGGGMYNEKSSPILSYVTFAGNTAKISGGGGGGMENKNYSYILLNHVTFSGNTTTSNAGAGGISNSGTCRIIVISSILWGNTANRSATQIYNEGNLSLYNSVLEGGKYGVGDYGTTDVYEGMQDKINPSLAPLTNNGGFVQTMLIPSNSSAKNIGHYAKRSGSIVYFSADNTSWFTIDAKTGAKASATPPDDAINFTDARGYTITDQPDAGAYEDGATAP